MDSINSIDDLTAALRATPIRSGTDDRLIEDIASTLLTLGVECECEHRLTGSLFVDVFLAELGIAILCRTKGHATAIRSELSRYAEQRDVEAVLLVSRRSNHDPGCEEMRSKPVRFLCLAGRDY